ncbi:MAG: ABC transporter ATP-binding protein [Litorilinea sp.]|nr:MAG: ABC transporter ATP-binding protein [Litorilinea sp.]
MNDIAIRVENLSKQYRIGARQTARYHTLRDTLMDVIRAPFRGWRNGASNGDEEHTIWALKDVSFEVKRGEVVGIIGRNGAGKSTLLKILSRITEPSGGRAEIHGRVGSLLEVGTGFHPELTGRENIYLNGAILGMRKAEIERKFDEIVAFAEVEKFIDTPVKHYSSGMYVRLAFAVAAHLEPEILLVDEVLAVGDAAFQKKCLGKMGDVAKEGRTVLFVSHNMGAVNLLCPRSFWLDSGELKLDDSTERVIQTYLDKISNRAESEVNLDRPNQNCEAYFNRIAVIAHNGRPGGRVESSKPFYVELEYTICRPLTGLEVSFGVFNEQGVRVFTCYKSAGDPRHQDYFAPGRYRSRVEIPDSFLMPGRYTITAGLHQPNVRLFDRKDHIVGFQLIDSGSHVTRFVGSDGGQVIVSFSWSTTKVSRE